MYLKINMNNVHKQAIKHATQKAILYRDCKTYILLNYFR